MSNDPFDVGMPVIVVDRILVRPGALKEVIQRFADDYKGLASKRGLQQRSIRIFPPFDGLDRESELTIEWEYASLPALWMARGPEEMDPNVVNFWNGLQPLVVSRSRRLVRDRLASVPAIEPADEFAARQKRTISFLNVPSDSEGILKHMSLLGLKGGINEGGNSFLPGGITVEGTAGAEFGPLVDQIVISPISGGIREANISTGVKRTILLRLMDGMGDDARRHLENELAALAANVSDIRNWVISRVIESDRQTKWTHCIEQEFTDVEHISGAYLNHPYHWSIVDRLFHPEAPERICDAFFQTVYLIERSVLVNTF